MHWVFRVVSEGSSLWGGGAFFAGLRESDNSQIKSNKVFMVFIFRDRHKLVGMLSTTSSMNKRGHFGSSARIVLKIRRPRLDVQPWWPVEHCDCTISFLSITFAVPSISAWELHKCRPGMRVLNLSRYSR